MSSYCTDADVTAFLPSGGLPNPARAVTADATTDVFTSDGHGLRNDAEVTFRAETEIAGAAMPSGLTAGTTYYAIVLTASTFKVSATSGGSAVDITTNGASLCFGSPLPMAEWREWGARQIDGMLPPHVVPIVPDGSGDYPAVVVTANAELAAAMGLAKTGGAEVDALSERIDAIRIRLKDWVKANPLRGTAASTQSPVNLAITSTAGSADPRGWAPCPTRIP